MVALLQAETCEMFATETNITKTQISDIILALESMLCYRAWLKLDSYWKYSDTGTFHDVQEAIATLLRQIIACVPRTTGNNWEIAKIHEQLHVAENILLFGAHRNVHTGPQEHNHIENTKRPSRQVQKGKNN